MEGLFPRKIGALGLRIERGVSYHGIALNVVHGIVPADENPAAAAAAAGVALLQGAGSSRVREAGMSERELGLGGALVVIVLALVSMGVYAMLGHRPDADAEERGSQFLLGAGD